MNATPEDPAIRLGLQISGTDILGNAISLWLQWKGMQYSLKVNDLVDISAGKTDERIGPTPVAGLSETCYVED